MCVALLLLSVSEAHKAAMCVLPTFVPYPQLKEIKDGRPAVEVGETQTTRHGGEVK